MTAAEYKLIDNAGAQAIVPYSGADVSYASIAKRMRDEGVTHALLKEAAPITVTCFAKNLKIYAEEIPFAGHGKTQTAGSGVFLLCPQYTDLYSDELGLHLPQEESFESIF